MTTSHGTPSTASAPAGHSTRSGHGAPHHGAVGGLFDMALTDQLIRHSRGKVHVLPTEVSQ